MRSIQGAVCVLASQGRSRPRKMPIWGPGHSLRLPGQAANWKASALDPEQGGYGQRRTLAEAARSGPQFWPWCPGLEGPKSACEGAEAGKLRLQVLPGLGGHLSVLPQECPAAAHRDRCACCLEVSQGPWPPCSWPEVLALVVLPWTERCCLPQDEFRAVPPWMQLMLPDQHSSCFVGS